VANPSFGLLAVRARVPVPCSLNRMHSFIATSPLP
jgi:hypothetical protein